MSATRAANPKVLSPADRAFAVDVGAALSRLRLLDPKINIEEALALLMVGANPGIVPRDIGSELGLQSGSLSRVMGRLSEYGDRKQPGLSLIYAGEDPNDRRQKPLYLTNIGHQVVLDVLNDLRKGAGHVSPPEG